MTKAARTLRASQLRPRSFQHLVKDILKDLEREEVESEKREQPSLGLQDCTAPAARTGSRIQVAGVIRAPERKLPAFGVGTLLAFSLQPIGVQAETGKAC